MDKQANCYARLIYRTEPLIYLLTTSPMRQVVERFRGDDNYHIQFAQQDNQLSAMSPREVEMMVAYPVSYRWQRRQLP